MSEVRILVIDDDIASQRAMKHILDSEGWRVRIVTEGGLALGELAGGPWSLVIVSTALIDLHGPLFSTLRELAQADPVTRSGAGPAADGTSASMLRVLFLLPPGTNANVQAALEEAGLPYEWKPCHLHDFLEKVSELLLEGGAIAQPVRSIGGFLDRRKRRKNNGFSREAGHGAMFASREDYQMSEEELAEFEEQEETDRKKREKKQRELISG